MATRARHSAGYTIIEALIGITILTMVTLALFAVMTANLTTLFQSRARGIALAIAQEKLENLKNLPYDSLATQSGTIYPAGTIPDNETIIRNGLTFKVHTDIRYVDNSYDGNVTGTVQGKPTDLYSYDYKKVTIQVSTPTGSAQLAELSSDIAAKAAETAGNTGVLLIKAINASGNPVEGATVQITNTNPNPDVAITTTTDIQGQVIIPKLPPDTNPGYHVTVSKAGYSSDQTFAIDAQHPTPANPDFAMLAQQITTKTFTIDQLANLSLNIIDQAGNPLISQSVSTHGQKITNNTPVVYKISQTISTDSQGVVQFNLIDWDSYTLSIPGYTILSTSPLAPITVAPNTLVTASVIAATSPTLFPIITSVTPANSAPSANVTIDVTGSNFNDSSTIILRKSGEPDRSATSVTYTGPDTLSGIFDLSSANGSYDLLITTSGRTTTQKNAVVVSP
ncbi:carboxypeptidase regulatory-like domain-containing protein [bacterium]|nr:carboxypeptidase regulatory-like domain-containing protein [bacterium]